MNDLFISKREKVFDVIEACVPTYVADPDAIFLCGSQARNDQNSKSDIDILVICPNDSEIVCRHVVTRNNDSWIDMKIFDIETLNLEIAAQIRSGMCPMVEELRGAIQIYGDLSIGLAITNATSCHLFLDGKFRIAEAKLSVWSLLQDAPYLRNIGEICLLASKIHEILAQSYFWAHGSPAPGGGKYILRKLAKEDPFLADRLLASVTDCISDGDFSGMELIANEIFQGHGGIGFKTIDFSMTPIKNLIILES